MSSTKYAYQGFDEKTMAKAFGRGLPISTKKTVETCRLIRGRSVTQAKAMLNEVVNLKRAVPYKRYNQELAHQKATGPGGYPVAVCKSLIKMLASIETNASAKGLNEDSLKIVHACAHLASRPMRYGRKRRVKAKRTHVEIVVQEMEKPKKTPAKSKKAEAKPATKGSEAAGKDSKSKDSKVVSEAKKDSGKDDAKAQPMKENAPKPESPAAPEEKSVGSGDNSEKDEKDETEDAKEKVAKDAHTHQHKEQKKEDDAQ